MIGKVTPSLEEQTNYTTCLDQRGEMDIINDAITNNGKAKCEKQKFEVNDE